MISLLTDMGVQLLFEFPIYGMLMVLTFAFVRWCVKWKTGRIFCGIVLLGLSAGLIYGLLRATGVILYPDDNYMSWNDFDSSFRTEGILLVTPSVLEMATILTTGWYFSRTKVTQ